jgi:hypothetical protein
MAIVLSLIISSENVFDIVFNDAFFAAGMKTDYFLTDEEETDTKIIQ